MKKLANISSPCHPVTLAPCLLLALMLLIAIPACSARETPAPQPASAASSSAAAAAPSTNPGSTLITGDRAPNFTLDDAHGGSVTLAQLTPKKNVILVFYLGYTCPRCVAHLRGLANDYDKLQKLNTEVLAISPDPIADSKDAINEFGDFPFPILSDPDHKVFSAYDLVLQNTDLLHGCFIIDTGGKIRFIRRGNHPFDDTDAIIEELQVLQAREQHEGNR